MNIRVHATENIFDHEGSFSGAKACMHIGDFSCCLILMHRTYIPVC